MDNKIEISSKYFLKHIIAKLESINEKLSEVDDTLYNKDEMFEEWNKIRASKLELDELIDAIK